MKSFWVIACTQWWRRYLVDKLPPTVSRNDVAKCLWRGVGVNRNTIRGCLSLHLQSLTRPWKSSKTVPWLRSVNDVVGSYVWRTVHVLYTRHSVHTTWLLFSEGITSVDPGKNFEIMTTSVAYPPPPVFHTPYELKYIPSQELVNAIARSR